MPFPGLSSSGDQVLGKGTLPSVWCILSPPQKRHKAHRLVHPETEAGTGRGEVTLHLGREPSSSSWLPELLRDREGTKCRPNRVCAFVEDPKTGCVRHAGSAPYKAAGSLSSVDRESTHAVSGGKHIVVGTLRVLPTHASDICLQCPSLPTARLSKLT